MSDLFCLSDVGEGIHEAEIVRWLVTVGDMVEAFQPLVEVQTDKALVELSSPRAGKIAELCGDIGTVVHVGDMLVRYEADAVKAATAQVLQPVQNLQDNVALAQYSHSQGADSLTHGADHGQRVLAAPATRKYARQRGVDLTLITGTGPRGRITRQDVELALMHPPLPQNEESGVKTPSSVPEPTQPQVDQPEVERVALRGLRRAIADHMVKSAFTAPHVSAFDDCDVTELVALRQRLLAQMRVLDAKARLTYMPFFVKAVLAALRAYPEFNAHMDEEKQELVIYKQPQIGIAVDTKDGLLVPVLRDPRKKTIVQLQSELDESIERARTRKASLSELKGSTFTITNVGAIGGTYATPILNHPEVAIFGVHKIEQRAVVREGQIVIREMMTMSMSFDHRVIDGAKGVRFMNEVKKWLEHPELLTLY
ncbi:dihydrolipoamide acetyltransferase family protein [Sulfoacidibacillus thermotolerans]|uniref:Dihydrolipoamide acetyltransferase component of pyruvate dehydrogenase complex n=1 Tax=Sulfoacidibacillus thermotolerans TaxID=1765684 RepID=A0A2U3D7I2_SULT2|nr:dihydrolipoamide acetyltransferase family protein [Sulfoacidibacillus thermotolerans]PWI57246.1 hypothetical protein BM613_09675 [Sulfoacidibacillus thermotolerans]